MKKITKLVSFFTTIIVAGSALLGCAQHQDQPTTHTALLSTLPYTMNSPASFTIDAHNNVLFTSPNLHNEKFIEQGLMKHAAAATIGLIDENDQISTWYTFKPEDLEPSSGVVTPMGIALGPDGNVYVADFQLWFGGESRLLRINVKNGKAIDVDVVAKGFSFPNAVAWKGDELFITDTVLSTKKGSYTTSGLYKISLQELNAANILQIDPYKNKHNHDAHLFETFTSNGQLGFGANGLTVDSDGSLYTTIMEDGSVFKTVFDEQNNKLGSHLFTQGMIAADGIQWDQRSQALYTTDIFNNAAYRIDMEGNMTLLSKNGDSNGEHGELDAPSEIIVRGNKAYVANFDAVFAEPNMVNTTPDAPITLSVITLE